MWALAADRIVMGKHSQLGPIDPQVPSSGNLVLASALVRQFRQVSDECKTRPATLSALCGLFPQFRSPFRPSSDRDQMIDIGGDVSRLRSSVGGRVMLPGQDGYDSARALWNAIVDRRPAVVVQCINSADVATAIDFARNHDFRSGSAVAGTAY
jgi:Serine dehydrogenase proteinase